MAVSVFDLFRIGIGPSSSHTVGPMRAARDFALALDERRLLASVAAVRAELYGSLALTGRGHKTDEAIILGLLGETPETVDPDAAPRLVQAVRDGGRLALLGRRAVPFRDGEHLLFRAGETLPRHTNGMRFSAMRADQSVLHTGLSYSVGGGFVVHDGASEDAAAPARSLPYPFRSAAELLEQAHAAGLTIAELARANERVRRSDAEIDDGLDRIWAAMQACVARGLRQQGELPGGLRVQRRSPQLHARLRARAGGNEVDALHAMEWINLFALAVSEENAAGGRVVTAPTNGAAGIVPAVLHYYVDFYSSSGHRSGVHAFLLTAAAIGSLYKENASISGAEVGCQGEVGVACSMAAAGLTAALGGSNAQIENAAEIGMEHNLGLTCDPVRGLVQVPCIERNAIGAVKAVNAARMALHGDGTHIVSLDRVIATMRQTGADMQTKYKETALGGLAVNVVGC